MADIKQAAKWMQESHDVRRPDFFKGFYYFLRPGTSYVDCSDGDMDLEQLNIQDLLAEDWEIAE